MSVYQSDAYMDMMARHEKAERVGGKLFKDGLLFTPYGYGDDTGITCKKGGLVKRIFIRNSPWLDNVKDGIRQRTTYMRDLSVPVTDKKILASVRRSEKEGLSFYPAPDLGEFRDLYYRSMNDKKAEGGYYYDLEDIKTLVGLGYCFGAYTPNGRMVAGAIFLSDGEWCHYHLSAVNKDYKSQQMEFLMFNAFRVLGYTHRFLHLGGGLKDGDGLSRFKKKLSTGELEYRTKTI